jgi:uncharacterized protein (DUF488 family)
MSWCYDGAGGLEMNASITIYTIGHSNHAPEEFLNLIGQHGIQSLVDVRSVPYSRFAPHFNGQHMRSWFPAHDLDYTFAGEFLGGRPSDAMYYKTRQLPSGKADYLNLVDYAAVANAAWFKRGIRRLIEIANAKTTVIMCSEEDPQRCHRRWLIEPALCHEGIPVLHIRKNGTLETLEHSQNANSAAPDPQLSLFAFD